jgi:hypothetical protein
MDAFDEFIAMHGPGIDCRPIRPETVQRYDKRLPQELLDFLGEHGFCGWAQGLIWFVDPDEFQDVMSEWLPDDKQSVPFARTAFGDLFLHGADGVRTLVVHSGEILPSSPRLDLFVQVALTDKDFLDSSLFRRVFKKALKRVGAPAADECYAFTPALALGGPGTPESVQKVKLKEHLSILAQLNKQ